MIRIRLLFAFGLLTALALAAGCGKKTDPTPGPGPDPKPGGDPVAAVAKAAKADARKRLQQIGLAMHNYEATMGQLPAGIVGPKGEIGLSWRVQILPYIEGDRDAAKLYEQFNLKEPWDSEHNKKLLAKMPKVFESPGKAAEGKTHLRSFAGETAFVRLPPQGFVPKGKAPPPPFPNLQPGMPVPGNRLAGISDGTSNTIAVAEAPEAVEWTKPDDLPFRGFPTLEKPIPAPKLGGVFDGGFHGLMCDGAVHFFPATLSDKTLAAMITVNGGEVLPAEVNETLFPPDPKKAAIPQGVPDDLPDAAARKTAVANYQKILKGAHEYHDFYGYLPAGVVANKAVGLSWRVQILPYIGEEKLYKEFKLHEPWDSEHNKKLIEKMPAAFASPGKAAEKGHTFVRTTQGPGGMIRTRPAKKGEPEAVEFRPDAQPGSPVPGRPLVGIPDGLSNTILFTEAGDAVPWTKPDELFLPRLGDPGRSGPPKDAKLPPLGGVFADGFHAVMADGVVTFYKTGYPSGELAKMFCPDDGWVIETRGDPEKILYVIPPPKPAGNPVPMKGGTIK
jgi:hypothetical protein